MTRKQLWNMKNALPRTTFLAIGIAAAGLLITPSASFAKDTKELAALKTALSALGGGTDIVTANAGLLAQAVIDAKTANAALKLGNIAGEALKYNTNDPGDEIAAKVLAAVIAPADRQVVVADAAVRATTQAGANPTNVPDFSSFFVDTNADAQTIAKRAAKSSTAIGAIFGGRALDLATVGDWVVVGNLGIQDPKLKKAAQQIAQFVGDAVPGDTEAAQFATALSAANTTQIQKIAVGVTTSNPTAAGGIIAGLLGNATTTQGTVKIAPKIAKAVGVVADVEQVQVMASSFGAFVSSKQAVSVVKALVQGISTRNPKSPVNGAGALSTINKSDEIGEVVAYFVAALAHSNANFDAILADAKKGPALIFSIAKAVFQGAKVKAIKTAGQKSDALQQGLLAKAGNFGASLAFTLKQLVVAGDLTQDVVNAFAAKIDSKSVNSIGGAKNAAAIQAQFDAGFAADAATKGFEDGTAVGSVIDPETDIRNG